MKRTLIFLAMATAMLGLRAQNPSTQTNGSVATAPQDAKAINTDSLHIDVSYMIPQRYGARAVTNYSLCLRGDTVMSHLPYMGRAYQATFGHTDGLTFTCPIAKKTIRTGRKGKTIISFSCRNNATRYDFRIEAYPGGSAYIRLTPGNADAIDYRGDWE